ncbi:MAG: Omp28-related outer membrane protein [Rikenellaceae bacterium]
MKTMKFISLLAMVAFTFACSSSNSDDVVTPPTPDEPDKPIVDTKLPADPKPTQFDNFFKRTMVVNNTGTGCGVCPRIAASLNNIGDGPDADQIVSVVAHTYSKSDPMYNTMATKYKAYCGVSSFPSVNLDLRKTKDATFSDGTPAQILAKCKALKTKFPAKVGISAAVEFVDGNFLVHTSIKIAADGVYKIGAIVVEDGVKAKQANNGYTGYDFNIHRNAVRGGSPSGNVTGEELGAGTLIKGSIVPKEFIIPLPAKTKAENAKIVVYVSTPDTDGGKLYINNVVVCKVGAPVAFKYND